MQTYQKKMKDELESNLQTVSEQLTKFMRGGGVRVETLLSTDNKISAIQIKRGNVSFSQKGNTLKTEA